MTLSEPLTNDTDKNLPAGTVLLVWLPWAKFPAGALVLDCDQYGRPVVDNGAFADTLRGPVGKRPDMTEVRIVRD